MSLPLSQITFTLTVLVTTYLIRYTGQDPNPPKPEDKSTARGKSSARPLPAKDKGPKESGTRHVSTDSLISTYFNVTPARYINILTAIGVAHGIFALIPDAGREAICPNYHSSSTSPSPMYFTWNTYTSSTLLFIWTSLLLRIAAYRSLGSSFTFRITKPTSGLKTTGVHRFIRHPSYTGYFGSTIGMVMLFLRARGLMGCIVGPGFVGKVVEGLFWVWAVALVPAVFWVRVREEEAFLAEEFGEEWEAYVERTWMFVPGVL